MMHIVVMKAKDDMKCTNILLLFDQRVGIDNSEDFVLVGMVIYLQVGTMSHRVVDV